MNTMKRKLILLVMFVVAVLAGGLPSKALAEGVPNVTYATHVQKIGWQGAVSNGQTAGTTGMSRRLEALTAKLNTNEDLGIEYNVHVQKIGWQGWRSNGQTAGTTGMSRRLEAICMRLTGSAKNKYHVQYRVHSQSFGWLGWAEDGELAGSCGYAKRAEAIQIRIVRASDGSVAGGTTGVAVRVKGALSGDAHVQKKGWTGTASVDVGDTLTLGSTGKGLRMEALKLWVSSNLGSGGIVCNAHVQTYGWMSDTHNAGSWGGNGAIVGTTGQSKRVEAVQIKLTGALGNDYSIWYRAHVQKRGWLGWTHDGLAAGSFGQSLRLEALEVMLVPKGGRHPAQTQEACVGVGTDAAYAMAKAGNGQTVRFDQKGGILYLPSWAASAWLPDGMRASATADDVGATNSFEVPAGTSKLWVATDAAYPPAPMTVMRSANIPSLSLTSASANQNRAWVESSSTHDNKATGSMIMVWPDTSVSYSGGLSQIKGRGNYTWELAKKPYQIKLDAKADLLDTGVDANAAKTWVLLAGYGDPALMRDAMSFNMGRSLGLDGTPESCFVDLWYDNEYRGTYLLSEKVQVGSGRVEIPEIKNGSSTGASLDSLPVASGTNKYGYEYHYVQGAVGAADAGGYLVEQDSHYYATERSWFNTSKGAFVLKDPENASEEQVRALSERFQELIDKGSDKSLFDDAESSPAMDLDSAAKTWLIQTLAKNRDYAYSSTFSYCTDSEGTVFSGPLWDFNAGYGIHPKATAREITGMEYSSDMWFYENPWFRKRVREIFNEEFKPLVSNVVLGGGAAAHDSCSVYGLMKLLGYSQAMNQSIWGVTAYDANGLSGTTWNSNVEALRSWLSRRLSYMDGIINSEDWFNEAMLEEPAQDPPLEGQSIEDALEQDATEQDAPEQMTPEQDATEQDAPEQTTPEQYVTEKSVPEAEIEASAS